MTRRSLLPAFLAPAIIDVAEAQGSPSGEKFFSINLVYDSQNQTPDTRPTTWGQAGFVDIPVKFINVPHSVTLTRWDGDFYGFIHSAPGSPALPGSHAGAMAGIITRASGTTPENRPSPDVPPELQASLDCCLWVCDSMSAENSKFRVSINWSFGETGAVDSTTNTILIRMAVMLNDTGLPIHMEITGILRFVIQ